MSDVPVVIAHRGASGHLPEHSLAAKALAYGVGADYLEQDLVVSRDHQLLVLHDTWLDDVSDVAHRFPGRHRADGRHYCIDFDLDEIRTLRFGERIDPATGAPRFPGRFPQDGPACGVVTFEEEILFSKSLNATIGRNVGIYPEIKAPAWHRKQGVDITTLVIDMLDRHGYLAADADVFIQCFDADTLQDIRRRIGPAPRLIRLLASRRRVTSAVLRATAQYATGIGPSLKLILRGYDEAGQAIVSDLVADAHDAGLVVHPYTLRADELPDGCRALTDLVDLLAGDLRVEGLFTDFPDQVAARLAARV